MPWMMLLMMHQPHLHQLWRLDRCNPHILFHHSVQRVEDWGPSVEVVVTCSDLACLNRGMICGETPLSLHVGVSVFLCGL